jgi:hypothetical protein
MSVRSLGVLDLQDLIPGAVAAVAAVPLPQRLPRTSPRRPAAVDAARVAALPAPDRRKVTRPARPGPLVASRCCRSRRAVFRANLRTALDQLGLGPRTIGPVVDSVDDGLGVTGLPRTSCPGH